MVTLGDLLLEFVKSIMELQSKYRTLDREKRDRIATYIEHVAGILDNIVAKFERGEEFTGMKRELSYYASGAFRAIIEDVVNDNEKADILCRSLQRVISIDYFLWDIHLLKLKGKEISRTLSYTEVVDVAYLKYRFQDSDDFPETLNIKDYLTANELDIIVNQELDRIRETSGLFKAIAVEIRATY